MHNDGVRVCCDRCAVSASDGESCFDVRVPVQGPGGETLGNAEIRCVVTPAAHSLSLLVFTATEAAKSPLMNIDSSLVEVLDQLEKHRVCGNASICPKEVVQICRRVEEA